MNFIRASIALIAITLVFMVLCVCSVTLKLLHKIFGFRSLYNCMLREVYFLAIKLVDIILLDILGLEIQITGSDKLLESDWHVLVSNHQSFMDILLIQVFCMRNKLDNKFFMKNSLLYMPFIGLACWGADFVFIKRFSKKALKNNPEKIISLHNYIKAKCAKFLLTPITVVNFIEGTRANSKKFTSSQYKNILSPQPMGLSLIISSMDKIKKIIDVSIVYPFDNPSFLSLFYGSSKKILIHYRICNIEQDLVGDYRQDKIYRKHFNIWLKSFWCAKDQIINDLKR